MFIFNNPPVLPTEPHRTPQNPDKYGSTDDSQILCVFYQLYSFSFIEKYYFVYYFFIWNKKTKCFSELEQNQRTMDLSNVNILKQERSWDTSLNRTFKNIINKLVFVSNHFCNFLKQCDITPAPSCDWSDQKGGGACSLCFLMN